MFPSDETLERHHYHPHYHVKTVPAQRSRSFTSPRTTSSPSSTHTPTSIVFTSPPPISPKRNSHPRRFSAFKFPNPDRKGEMGSKTQNKNF